MITQKFQSLFLVLTLLAHFFAERQCAPTCMCPINNPAKEELFKNIVKLLNEVIKNCGPVYQQTLPTTVTSDLTTPEYVDTTTKETPSTFSEPVTTEITTQTVSNTPTETTSLQPTTVIDTTTPVGTTVVSITTPLITTSTTTSTTDIVSTTVPSTTSVFTTTEEQFTIVSDKSSTSTDAHSSPSTIIFTEGTSDTVPSSIRTSTEKTTVEIVSNTPVTESLETSDATSTTTQAAVTVSTPEEPGLIVVEIPWNPSMFTTLDDAAAATDTNVNPISIPTQLFTTPSVPPTLPVLGTRVELL